MGENPATHSVQLGAREHKEQSTKSSGHCLPRAHKKQQQQLISIRGLFNWWRRCRMCALGLKSRRPLILDGQTQMIKGRPATLKRQLPGAERALRRTNDPDVNKILRGARAGAVMSGEAGSASRRVKVVAWEVAREQSLAPRKRPTLGLIQFFPSSKPPEVGCQLFGLRRARQGELEQWTSWLMQRVSHLILVGRVY